MADPPSWIWDVTRGMYYWIDYANSEYVYQDGTRVS
jgi:hypothetical protein